MYSFNDDYRSVTDSLGETVPLSLVASELCRILHEAGRPLPDITVLDRLHDRGFRTSHVRKALERGQGYRIWKRLIVRSRGTRGFLELNKDFVAGPLREEPGPAKRTGRKARRKAKGGSPEDRAKAVLRWLER